MSDPRSHGRDPDDTQTVDWIERAFLTKVIDGIRQGDTLPIVAERLARRAGWKAEEAFALAEELTDRGTR